MSVVKMFRDSEYNNCVACEYADSSRATRLIKKGAASFSLKDTPSPCVSLDCDLPPIDQNASRCDYIFAAGGKVGYVSPIEMTSGMKKNERRCLATASRR